MQVKGSRKGENSCDGTEMFIPDREKFEIHSFEIER